MTSTSIWPLVPVHVPTEITNGGLMNSRSDVREVGGDVVLKAVLADKMQQLLHSSNLDNSCATEGVQRVVSESALANVAAYRARRVVGGEASEAHGIGLDQPHACAKCVLLAHCAGNDFLEIHLCRAEEMLGQVRAMEAYRLVRVFAVVVIPIEKCRRSAGGELERVHREHATNVSFASTRKQFVTHHAHHCTRPHTEIFFEGSPALYRADAYLCGSHPMIDHRTKFRHFEQRRRRYIAGIYITMNGLQLGLHGIVGVFYALNASEDFGKVEGLDGN